MIAYEFKQLKVHERNYPAYNLELAAVVFAWKLWRHYLYGVHMDLFIYHKSLHYVFTQRKLNLRQWRLLDDLRTRVIAEAHGSRYSIHLVFTKMYHDIKQIYW